MFPDESETLVEVKQEDIKTLDGETAVTCFAKLTGQDLASEDEVAGDPKGEEPLNTPSGTTDQPPTN